MTTYKQQDLVHFCEFVLDEPFEGDINSQRDVSIFLQAYLEDAKALYNELECEYHSYQWD